MRVFSYIYHMAIRKNSGSGTKPRKIKNARRAKAVKKGAKQTNVSVSKKKKSNSYNNYGT